MRKEYFSACLSQSSQTISKSSNPLNLLSTDWACIKFYLKSALKEMEILLVLWDKVLASQIILATPLWSQSPSPVFPKWQPVVCFWKHNHLSNSINIELFSTRQESRIKNRNWKEKRGKTNRKTNFSKFSRARSNPLELP